MHGLGDHIFEILRGYFDAHGYLTLFCALLLENAGIPIPGETMLLFASFLAFSEQQLRLPHIILIGILAATLGDNIGYSVGRRGGRPLLDRYLQTFRIRRHTVESGEELFARYGSIAIFLARFIFGMRIIAGPLAGVLRMPWRRFVLFNLLGAATWVTVISVAGYKFGQHWAELIRMIGRLHLVIALLAAYAAWHIWRRYRASRKKSGSAAGKSIGRREVEKTEAAIDSRLHR